MQTEEYIKKIDDHFSGHKQLDYNQFDFTVNQQFVNSGDLEGMMVFYDTLIKSELKPHQYDEVAISDVSQLIEELKLKSKEITVSEKIKAIYFEYFYDGGDSCTGDFFSCFRYDPADPFWASEFDMKDIVEGPKIDTYFDFDKDLEYTEKEGFYAYKYANSRILYAVANAIEDEELNALPVGFAMHDDEDIVMLKNA